MTPMLDPRLNTFTYISTDPARVEYWKNELSALPGLRVGISWQGSLDHRGDRMRSVPLTRFAEFAKIPCITLCSLQKTSAASSYWTQTSRM